MIISFEAEAVEVEINENNVLCIGFYTEENYLMIQKSLDIEVGDYHIERDDQSFGDYGGVEKIVLSPNRIVVNFDDEGQKKLECESVIVDFETDEENFVLLSEKLEFIFGSAVVEIN